MEIYLATNLTNGKQYVGLSTVSMESRRKQHFKKSKGNSPLKFHRAIRKYGKESFDWTVIDTAVTEEELCKKEMYWINKLNTFNNGYNMTLGGDGLNGYKNTREQKIQKAVANGMKPFYVFNLSGELVGEFISQSDCASELNLNNCMVGKVLLSQCNSSKGFTFIYKDEYSEDLLAEKLSNTTTHGRLTEKEVIEIKRMLLDGVKQKNIAEIFGVKPYAITDIKRGKAWSHVAIA